MPKKQTKPVTFASFKQAAAELSGFSKPAPKVKKRRDPDRPPPVQEESAAPQSEARESKTRETPKKKCSSKRTCKPSTSRSKGTRSGDVAPDAAGSARSGASRRSGTREAPTGYPSGANRPDASADNGVQPPPGYPGGPASHPAPSEHYRGPEPEHPSPGYVGDHSAGEHSGGEEARAEEERRHRRRHTHGHGGKRKRGKRKSRRHGEHRRKEYGSDDEAEEHGMFPHAPSHHGMPPHPMPRPHGMGHASPYNSPSHQFPIPHPIGAPVGHFTEYGRSHVEAEQAEMERRMRHDEQRKHDRYRRRSRSRSRPRDHRRDEERRTHREHRHRGERRGHREHREHGEHRERGAHRERGGHGRNGNHGRRHRKSHRDRHHNRDHSPDLSEHKSSIRDAEYENQLLREGHALAPSRHSSDEEGPASLSLILPNDHDSGSDVDNDQGSDFSDQEWDHNRSQAHPERHSQHGHHGGGSRHSRDDNYEKRGIGTKLASAARNAVGSLGQEGGTTRAIAERLTSHRERHSQDSHHSGGSQHSRDGNQKSGGIRTKITSAARNAIESLGEEGGTTRAIAGGLASAAVGAVGGDDDIYNSGDEGRHHENRGTAAKFVSAARDVIRGEDGATRAIAEGITSAALGATDAHNSDDDERSHGIKTRLASAARNYIGSAADKGGPSRAILGGMASAALGVAAGDPNGTAGDEMRSVREIAQGITSTAMGATMGGGRDSVKSGRSHASERQGRRENAAGTPRFQHSGAPTASRDMADTARPPTAGGRHADGYRSDSTVPSGGEPDETPPLRRRPSARKGDHRHRKGSSARRRGKSRRGKHRESTHGGDEEGSAASEERAVRTRSGKGGRASRGSLRVQGRMNDADELDSRASRRAQDVMNNTQVPAGSVNILEKFLPAKAVPLMKTVVEAADVHGFLELGENESLAEDAFQRESKNKPFHVEVPQNFSYIIERCGKYKRRIDAGWHAILPILDRVKFVHSLMEEPMPIPQHQAFTADSISVLVEGVLFVKVVDPVAASYNVENPYRALLLLSQAITKKYIGSHNLRQAIANRPQMGEALEDEINLTVRDWGLDVTRIEITDLEPPQEMRAMMQAEAESKFQREVEFEQTQHERLQREGMEQHELHAQETEHLTNMYSGHNDSFHGSRGAPSAMSEDPVGYPRNDEDDFANDPDLEETLSEQQALGASWHTQAASSTRRVHVTHRHEHLHVQHVDHAEHVHLTHPAEHPQPPSQPSYPTPHEHHAEAVAHTSHAHHATSPAVSARNAPASLAAGHGSTNGMWDPIPNVHTADARSQLPSHPPTVVPPVYTTVPAFPAPQFLTQGAPVVGAQLTGPPQFVQIAVPVQANAQGHLMQMQSAAAFVSPAHTMTVPASGYPVGTHVVGAQQAQA